jgi:hypothetical protein
LIELLANRNFGWNIRLKESFLIIKIVDLTTIFLWKSYIIWVKIDFIIYCY